MSEESENPRRRVVNNLIRYFLTFKPIKSKEKYKGGDEGGGGDEQHEGYEDKDRPRKFYRNTGAVKWLMQCESAT